MGFGHRVYKTDDPRSLFLRDVAQAIDAPLVDFACDVERIVVEVLAELKPGHKLYANVEFFAGVVMNACGIPRQMFTPTFASSRVIGWAAQAMEQAGDNRLIRPTARYVGPPPPQPVPRRAEGTPGPIAVQEGGTRARASAARARARVPAVITAARRGLRPVRAPSSRPHRARPTDKARPQAKAPAEMQVRATI